jgi:hypothetical protein
VRALGLGDQEQDAFLDRRFHHQHVVAVDLLGLAGLATSSAAFFQLMTCR